ncbi:MAG: hypothetical protein LW884_02945 [Bacteroidetes bacterium]|jgi:hypothetical protein|nr:hypothetical protein [Bacteroidota bacterium]
MKTPLLRCTLLALLLLALQPTHAQPPIAWDKTLGGGENDGPGIIRQTSDGGYIVAGDSESGIEGTKTDTKRGSGDYWIIKLDKSGHVQWDKTIGGNGNDRLSSLELASDGGYLLGGSSGSQAGFEKSENSRGPAGRNDYWVVKLDSEGTLLWDKTLGGNFDDFLETFKETKDGGYILGGHSRSDNSFDKTEENRGASFSSADYWVIKLDKERNIRVAENIWRIAQIVAVGDWRRKSKGYNSNNRWRVCFVRKFSI